VRVRVQIFIEQIDSQFFLKKGPDLGICKIPTRFFWNDCVRNLFFSMSDTEAK